MPNDQNPPAQNKFDEALLRGVQTAGRVTELQIEEARRVLAAQGFAGSTEKILAMTQIIATNWAGLE